MSAFRAALQGKVYIGSVSFVAASSAAVVLPQGMGDLDYRISCTPIAAAGPAPNWRITGKDTSGFTISLDAVFTGTMDVIVIG